jgi:hypothetical protein
MAERAMSEEGVLKAAYQSLSFAMIPLDYSPLSHGRVYVDSDVQLQEQMAHFRSQCAAVFAAGLSSGISPLGVGTIMTLIAADCASDRGISKFTILKSLVDVLMTFVEQDPLSDDPHKSDRGEVVKDTLSALLRSHIKH